MVLIKFGKQSNDSVRLSTSSILLSALLPLLGCAQSQMDIPHANVSLNIDGDLADWKNYAYSQGKWNLKRSSSEPWHSPKRSRLINEADEPTGSIDLSSTFYIAWSDSGLILGAEVEDNILDVVETEHLDERWYNKDGVAWFFELPYDTIPKRFAAGSVALCFIADTSYPEYGAWMRYGNDSADYLEQAIPKETQEYSVKVTTDGYIIEAFVSWELFRKYGQFSEEITETLGSMMIVNCDPDGGEYGGHLLIYGKGDNDATWTQITFSE